MVKINNITAVVVTYNPNLEMLDKEYNSIVGQVSRLIYVDNFSKDHYKLSEWASDKDNLQFIWLESNKGLGFAQNIGLKKAFEEGASHVILFDQDSVIDSGYVESLLKAEQLAIAQGHNVGLSGPIYQSHDESYFYPIVSIVNGKFTNIALGSFKDYVVVSHIIASGSLIRKELFEKVGLLEDKYFISYIDHEYAFRASKYGFETIVAKKAYMKHQMGDSQVKVLGRKIGLYSPFRRYFDCRNTMLIQKNPYFPKVYKRHYLKYIIGKFIISLIYGPQRMNQIKFSFRGFYDGIIGKTGKCPFVN